MKNLLKELKNLKKDKDKLLDLKNNLMRSIESLRKLNNISGEVLALSKQAINSSINDDFIKAEQHLKNAEQGLNKISKGIFKVKNILKKNILYKQDKINVYDFQNMYAPIDMLENSFKSAMEEYCEAKLVYYYFKNDHKIIKPKQLLPFCDFYIYAGALSDFCGELLRKARLDIIKIKNSKELIKKYYNDTKEIYFNIANFSFSNKSGIRGKVENLKGYIERFEEILYDLSKK